MENNKAYIPEKECVSCGSCIKVCPQSAISMHNGLYAAVNQELCISCGRCAAECPASIINIKHVNVHNEKQNKKWYDYLWIFTICFFVLGFFNILFAWLGMICFIAPLLFAIIGGNKGFCNKYCDRSQLLTLLGGRFGLSRRKTVPNWLKSKAFRYGFLIFFFAMFFVMLYNTYLVFAGATNLKQVITVLWTFNVPWNWAYHGDLFAPWITQYAFGFYSVMLTSTILGIITMILFKPRSWCVYCPMGTMTQFICRIRNYKKD